MVPPTPRPAGNAAPVLLLDSGIGGLSIAREIAALRPELGLVYACDDGYFPYGDKPEAALVDRVEAVTAAAAGLVPPALIVVACNTASTVALPRLRARFAVPVVGVVPAIKPAAALSAKGIIGVLGTEATAQRAYTRDLIERFAGGCRVILVGSADLVRLAETHADRSAPPAGAIESILAPFFDRADSERPDVLVLACTHFPLLRDQLQAACPEGVRLIDSGAAVARRVASLLGPGDPTEADPVRLACVTGAGDRRDLLKAEGFGRVETLRLAETLRHMTAN